MEEFDKIKAFSESVAQRQENLAEQKDDTNASGKAESDASSLDLPQYLSQFRPQVPEEKSDMNLLVWTIASLGFLLLAGVGAFFYLYGPKEDAQEIVVISPTLAPVKVRPENPGGLQIAGTDKVVYDRTSAHKAEVVEKLFPEPEQPVLPPPEQTITEVDIEKNIIVTDPPIPQEIEVVPVVVEPVPAVTTPAIMAPLSAGKKLEAVAEKNVVSEKETQTPKTEEKKPEVSVNSQKWHAQLLSSANKKKVELAWKDIQKKQKTLLSDMPYKITSVDIPGKGTFYRLQVGEFSNKEMVVNLCDKLKKKKQDCIPAK